MFHSRPAHHVRAYRPRLQVLEDRTLLSTYLVDHLADDGVGSGTSGSLRYCITNAVDGDAITFGVTGTINLTGALPGLGHNISINGPGANLMTLNGGHAFSVWATVAISGLTIANGRGVDDVGYWYGHPGGGIFNAGTLSVSNCVLSANVADLGGGIFNYDGQLTVTNCTLTGNEAFGVGSGGPGVLGGGIYNLATLTISNSTIAGNKGDGGFFGGGVGGIFNYYGQLTVSNSTIYGNTAGSVSGVGGIYNLDDATLTVSNSTISGNKGGYYLGQGIASRGTLNMRNSIVADNRDADRRPAEDLSGYLTSSGYNLIGDGSDASGFVDTDLVGTGDNPINPRLGPLQNNGGPTQTMALLAISPALNAGDPAQLGIPDQRGVVRKGGVNIGAYQASASAFLLTAPDTVTSGTAFDVTVTAIDRFGQPAYGYTGTVTFSTGDRDPNVVLPADYTFTAADQGAHTFSSGFTLITPGDQTITTTDTADNTIAGSATVTVTNGGGGAAPNGPQPSLGPDAAQTSVHDSAVAAFAKNAGDSSQPAFLANAATSLANAATSECDLVFAGLGDVGLAPGIDFLADSVSPGWRDRN
jgi:hypothetical protein